MMIMWIQLHKHCVDLEREVLYSTPKIMNKKIPNLEKGYITDGYKPKTK